MIEGFLTRAAGEGLRVAGLSADEVRQSFRIRMLLESDGARRAAELATPDEGAKLKRLAQAMTDHTPPRGPAEDDAISEANAAFHRTIMQAARSSRLAARLSLAVNLGRVLRTCRIYSEQNMIRQSRHHQEIAEAIAARHPDRVARAMMAHVLAAAAVARRRAARGALPPGT
jgi:DNA-binding GntR family transcriptional regulator